MKNKTEAGFLLAAWHRLVKIQSVFANMKAWLAKPLHAPAPEEDYWAKGFHKYEGPDFGRCVHCGNCEESGDHRSAQEFSRECDEVFGK